MWSYLTATLLINPLLIYVEVKLGTPRMVAIESRTA
jgi:hypothetical protein